MRCASRDRRVFFWEEPVWHSPGELPLDQDGQLGMHLEIIEEAPSIWVIRPHLTWGIDFEAGQRSLLSKLIEQFSIRRLNRWFYTPMAFSFAQNVLAEVTVYDCMDELANFIGAASDLKEREGRLFENADIVFTGGLSLYEKKKQQHGNVHAFPSSIDREHFAAAKSGALAIPEDLAGIPKPRAGFYGVIDERFDVDLLAEVASLRPQIHFVILGPVVKINPVTLPQRENIHYLGAKSYDELPAYLAGWDIALLLFARNEATRYISPTKTPEYLAAGKPVISTPIEDVVRDYGEPGWVAIAATAEDFAAALDSALIPRPESWHREIDKKLAGSSWDSTWEAMQVEIDRVRNDKRRFEVSAHGEDSALRVSHSVAPHLATLRIETLGKTIPYVIPRVRISRSRRTEHFDYLVVGAGFAGSVLAERIASQLGKRVLLVDKREHIGGNAYDYYNSDGILVHKYGPHIFHTNSDEVVAYLSQFTSWRPYEHRVQASVDGQLLPIPINLDTINRLYGLTLDAEEMKVFLAARCLIPTVIKTSEDIVVSRVGRELYEKFFRNYTRKQWGLDPSELDASVAGRIPVRFDQDDRYFTDSFQAMPRDGYTRMFERMLDKPLIHLKTSTDYRDVAELYPQAKVIYTGPIDEYFDFAFGPLPYRSLEFRHETVDREVYQSSPVVNYPNEHPYTRITEFKYLTGQRHSKTSIVYEYPRAEGDPYYPIPRPENTALYSKYRELAKRDASVHFCGRLANYRYFNMDQVVAQALATFRNMTEKMYLSQASPAAEAASVTKDRGARVAIFAE